MLQVVRYRAITGERLSTCSCLPRPSCCDIIPVSETTGAAQHKHSK